MTEEFDLLAPALEFEEELRNTAPTGLELAVMGAGDNRFYTYVESEILDMAEFRYAVTERFLSETVGDLDSWQPVGILNAPHAPVAWTPPPPPASCEEEGWGEIRALVNSMFSAALREWERGMVVDRELQNARARLFWRAQRRMSITELLDMLGIHYGAASELLGRL